MTFLSPTPAPQRRTIGVSVALVTAFAAYVLGAATVWGVFLWRGLPSTAPQVATREPAPPSHSPPAQVVAPASPSTERLAASIENLATITGKAVEGLGRRQDNAESRMSAVESRVNALADQVRNMKQTAPPVPPVLRDRRFR